MAVRENSSTQLTGSLSLFLLIPYYLFIVIFVIFMQPCTQLIAFNGCLLILHLYSPESTRRTLLSPSSLQCPSRLTVPLLGSLAPFLGSLPPFLGFTHPSFRALSLLSLSLSSSTHSLPCQPSLVTAFSVEEDSSAAVSKSPGGIAAELRLAHVGVAIALGGAACPRGAANRHVHGILGRWGSGSFPAFMRSWVRPGRCPGRCAWRWHLGPWVGPLILVMIGWLPVLPPGGRGARRRGIGRGRNEFCKFIPLHVQVVIFSRLYIGIPSVVFLDAVNTDPSRFKMWFP